MAKTNRIDAITTHETFKSQHPQNDFTIGTATIAHCLMYNSCFQKAAKIFFRTDCTVTNGLL